MFLLAREKLPATPEALQAAMEEALRRFCTRDQPMVAIRGPDLRELEQIAVDLSGAAVDPLHRPQLAGQSEREPAVFVRELLVLGDPVNVFDSPLTVQLVASDVELDQTKKPDAGIFLVLRKAGSGSIRLALEKRELEQLIAKAAALAAKKQGVTVENVSLELIPHGLRTLDARLSVTARKLLFRAVMHLSGSATVDDNFFASVSNLRCEGEGAIAALACAAITPHFRTIEGRPLSLSALPVGELRLRDIAFAVDGERIEISAQFGSAAAKPG